MENLSHSVSKKICNGNLSGNGFAAKAVYDDVFGGPPKSGIPTFSPRVEDYGEIFGGFHASRSSSIPVLDLPVVDEAEVCFDVRSSKFDYAEVFGGLNGLDFAFSFEELFDQSNGGNESSEEAWTPAGTDSLSEGSDPSVHSGTNQGFSSGECHQTWDDVKQFNISYHKASQSVDNMPDGTHVTQIHAIPGFTFVVDEISPLQKAEGRNSVLQVTDDMNLEMDFSEMNIRGKHLGKSTSHPPNNSAGIHTLRKEIKSQRLCSENGSHLNEFVTVSEISLKTPPSELPPPSRPPPIKKGEPGGLVSDRKETNSYAFEGTTGDGSPPFFDVEVDASSSAAASAAAMKEAMEQAQAKLKSAKESMERKKEGRQSRVKQGSKSDVKDKEGKVYKVVNKFIDFKDKRVRGMHEEEENEMKPFVGEESHKVSQTTLGVPYSVEGEEFFDVVEKSKEKRHGEEAWSSQESYMSQTAGEWKEANEFFELVKTDKSRKPVEQANNEKIQVQNTKAMEFCHKEHRTAVEAYEEQEENPKKISAAREAQQQEEKGKKLKAAKEAHKRQEYEKVNLNQEVHELKEDDKKLNVAYMHGEMKEIQAQVDAWKEHDVVIKVKQEETRMEVKDAMMHEENKQSFSNTSEGMVNERRLREVCERRENGRRLKDTYQREEYKKKLREAFELAETERPEKDETEVRLKDAREQKDMDKSWKEAFGREENEKMLKEALELEGNEKKLKEAFEFKEYEKKRKEACEREESDKKLKEALEREENEKRLKEALEREEIEKKQREAHEREEHERKLREAWKKEEVEERVREVQEREDKKILRGTHKREANEKEIKEVFEQEEIEERSRQARRSVESEESIHDIVEGVELKEAENFKAYKEVSELDGKHNLRATEVAFKHEENNVQLEATQGVSADEESERLRTEPKDGDFVVEAVEKTSPLLDDRFGVSGLVQGHLQPEEIEIGREDVKESVLLDDNVKRSDKGVIGTGQAGFEENIGASQMGCNSKNMEETLCHGWEQRGKDVEQTQVAFDQELNKDEYKSTQVVNEGVKNGRKTEAAASRVLEGKGNNQKVAQHVSSGQGMESKKNNVKETLNPEEREKEERIKRERELEKDRLRKIEEEREREREREKDRMAVERATREVRERAYAEACERAERAAVERATAEARQRAMAEARERLEKACAEARGKSLTEKASMEARIRAERVAGERATAGARERAVEKAMVEKAAFEARERTERSASSSGSRYPYSLIYAASMEKFERVEGESAQRSKARLERHRRTAERAAKALAEKNTRDLLAQREQTERNRLAESLDADVKRWSSGKEGNLRALLSTLQYILGPDSGWQPIPLTDVITAAAVKKAYRKATLCVHPDKLQQRGASIHQKYICEKVFDLLKEAWNRFNSEER